MRGTGLATRALAVVTLAVTALTGPGLAVAGAATPSRVRTAEEATPTPLSVTMTLLSPSTIPAHGVLTISGLVKNDSKEDWTDINVSPFISSEPITTRDELAEAAASAPDVFVGNRLTAPSTQVLVGDLRPGQATSFTVRVRVDELEISGDPGVYWIGVHALGTSPEGRDLEADGRARTFIPLVPKSLARLRTVPLSVVLPVRDRARRTADGSLNGPTRWVHLTEPEGRLARLADFGSSAGDAPLTWMVDPAVLDALKDFGRGNPPLSLGPDRHAGQGDDQKDDDQRPDSSPSPSPSPPAESGTPSNEERDRANVVLNTLQAAVRSHPALALGYADPDVASLARRGPKLLRRSEDLSAKSMQAHNLIGSAVVSPPEGYFDPDLLGSLPSSTLMLLSDHGELDEPTLSKLPTGQDLVLTDERAVAGGPLPNPPRSPLALRQRLLAEAALEVTQGEAPIQPMVFSFPAGWNPGRYWRDADFFGGLDVPWLRLASLPRGASATFSGKLPYGRTQLADEIGPTNVAATRGLVHTSTVLGHLLANDNDVTDQLDGAALQASAYSAKPTLGLAADQVRALDATTRTQIDQVQVTGTDFVTLSGGSGSLTVTLVNGLKQPITVGLRARSDSSEVKVQTPKPVSMQAGERTTLRLRVSSGVGVHEVTLSPVTTQGENAGTPLTFGLRTSQVGRLIWYVIIAGGVLLAVMIVRRIVLRIRLNRWRVDEQ
ncbi:DUF6049 family protein [Marmoricola sp. URHB0036]|uniref:DUF6049 family protein n=1 Tax=Marmoricola sp. URHB0036 TaxID=1298863 RepID=UPI000419E650|nr:DUF6049 family protein [Marmoricola sp. URHB0036]